ncbi:hypothetical protein MPER_11394 [Moniliophthora perniciosa FA553]|nr:hypothetical protein MPER_11394 [Moniliophthora perniciosa FA553]
MAASVPVIQRHDQYYIETIVYQVENTLFRVPSRYFHEKSEVFSGASQISTTRGEGSSDDNPVKLVLPQDANTNDFLQLIRVICPLTFDLPVPTNLSHGDWVSVLKLSTAWCFNDLRKLAITKLSGSDGLDSSGSGYFHERVELGRRYSVKSWLLEGLEGLSAANDTNPLPLEKLETLGLKTAMRLVYIKNFHLTFKLKSPGLCGKSREDCPVTPASCSCCTNNNCNSCGRPRSEHPSRGELEPVSVEKVFMDELATLDESS